uniref:Uncharacterized protein n=1 Tax=Hucho hucho TaxID=62062 RepID=A0A4W5MP66_9TELE
FKFEIQLLWLEGILFMSEWTFCSRLGELTQQVKRISVAGGWDLQSHEVFPLGSTPMQPIRCCLAKGASLWVGYWNRVHVVDIESRKRSEQQVRFLCAAGSGVWTSCRLDPTLRLFDWSTGRPLQDVDLTPLVTKTLGPAFLSLSPLQISSLTFISGRLWVGTGSGAIFSIPVGQQQNDLRGNALTLVVCQLSSSLRSIGSESASIPYCSLAAAQLCYHGHRQAVKFIIAAPGENLLLLFIHSLLCNNAVILQQGYSTGGPRTISVSTSQLILSGGEGYINFRIGDGCLTDSASLLPFPGDDANDGAPEAAPLRSDRSHMIIWQSPTPSLPSSAL